MNQKYVALFLSFLIVSLSVVPSYVYAAASEEPPAAARISSGSISIDLNALASGTTGTDTITSGADGEPDETLQSTLGNQDNSACSPLSQLAVSSHIVSGATFTTGGCYCSSRPGRFHLGFDFLVALNTDVRTPVDGSVISTDASTSTNLGKYVKIQDNNGRVWVFGHLNEVLVATGGTVSKNMLIAKSGNTAKGISIVIPHVHMHVYVGAYTNRINPTCIINALQGIPCSAETAPNTCAGISLPTGTTAAGAQQTFQIKSVNIVNDDNKVKLGNQVCVGNNVKLEISVSGFQPAPRLALQMAIQQNSEPEVTFSCRPGLSSATCVYEGGVQSKLNPNTASTTNTISIVPIINNNYDLSQQHQITYESYSDSSCNPYHAEIRIYNPYNQNENLNRATLTVSGGQCTAVGKGDARVLNTWLCTSQQPNPTLTVDVPDTQPSVPSSSAAPSYSITRATRTAEREPAAAERETTVAERETTETPTGPDAACTILGGTCTEITAGGVFQQDMCGGSANRQCRLAGTENINTEPECTAHNAANKWCGTYCATGRSTCLSTTETPSPADKGIDSCYIGDTQLKANLKIYDSVDSASVKEEHTTGTIIYIRPITNYNIIINHDWCIVEMNRDFVEFYAKKTEIEIIIPKCNDGTKNGYESDVDCGTTTCGLCDNEKKCFVPNNCKSGFCSDRVCAEKPTAGQAAAITGLTHGVGEDAHETELEKVYKKFQQSVQFEPVGKPVRRYDIPIEPDFEKYSTCEVCTGRPNNYRWCSQENRPTSSAGTCKPRSDTCASNEAAFFDDDPNDELRVKCPAQTAKDIVNNVDGTKAECETAIENGFVWCRYQNGFGEPKEYNADANLNTVCGQNAQPILNTDACSKVDDIIENIIWNEVIAFAARYMASRSTPKFVQPPNDWEPEDGIEVPAALAKKRGTHICEAVSAAKINGELDKTNALSIQGTAPLFQAGNAITINGNVEKFSSTCNGLNFECRDHQLLGCKVSDKLFYLTLEQQKCKGEYGITVYQEMEKDKIWDWGFIVTVVASAVLPFFLTDVDTGVSKTGQPENGKVYNSNNQYNPFSANLQYTQYNAQSGGGSNLVGIVNALRGGGSSGSQKEWLMRFGIGIISGFFTKPDASKQRCFTVCGKVYQTKDPSRDTCENFVPPKTTKGTQVKREASIPGPKITLSYNQTAYDEEFGCAKNTACGAFENARIDVSLITPSGAVMPLSDTRTDSLGNYDVSFNAPSADGTFNAILKVKGVPPVQSSAATTTAAQQTQASQLTGGKT